MASLRHRLTGAVTAHRGREQIYAYKCVFASRRTLDGLTRPARPSRVQPPPRRKEPAILCADRHRFRTRCSRPSLPRPPAPSTHFPSHFPNKDRTRSLSRSLARPALCPIFSISMPPPPPPTATDAALHAPPHRARCRVNRLWARLRGSVDAVRPRPCRRHRPRPVNEEAVYCRHRRRHRRLLPHRHEGCRSHDQVYLEVEFWRRRRRRRMSFLISDCSSPSASVRCALLAPARRRFHSLRVVDLSSLIQMKIRRVQQVPQSRLIIDILGVLTWKKSEYLSASACDTSFLRLYYSEKRLNSKLCRSCCFVSQSIAQRFLKTVFYVMKCYSQRNLTLNFHCDFIIFPKISVVYA